MHARVAMDPEDYAAVALPLVGGDVSFYDVCGMEPGESGTGFLPSSSGQGQVSPDGVAANGTVPALEVGPVHVVGPLPVRPRWSQILETKNGPSFGVRNGSQFSGQNLFPMLARFFGRRLRALFSGRLVNFFFGASAKFGFPVLGSEMIPVLKPP